MTDETASAIKNATATIRIETEISSHSRRIEKKRNGYADYGNKNNTPMNNDADISCPGVEYLIQDTSAEVMYLNNVTYCENITLHFPSRQGMVYGRCQNAPTFCYLQVEAPEHKAIAANVSFIYSPICQTHHWAVYMYERHPQSMGPDLSSPDYHFTCRTAWRNSKHIIYWNTDRVYVLFRNNPQVSITFGEHEEYGLKICHVSQESGYVRLVSGPPADYWTSIGVPVGRVIATKFRIYYIPHGKCQAYCRIFHDRHGVHFGMSISICSDVYDTSAKVFNTSLLRINLFIPQKSTRFRAYIFYVFSDTPNPDFSSFDCIQYGIYYKKDCVQDGYCPGGLKEEIHCPLNAAGCMTWIQPIKKCLQITSGIKLLLHEQIVNQCKARGGNLATFKTKSDYVNSKRVIKAKLNTMDYTSNMVFIGLIVGWYMVPYMYRMFFQWSDKTIIYNRFEGLGDNTYSGTYPRYGMMMEGNIIFGRGHYSRPVRIYFCEYESKIQKRYSLTHVMFPALMHNTERTHNDLNVCPGGHLTHTFLACDVQSHCGQMKPPSVCILCQSCQHHHSKCLFGNGVITVTMFACDDDYTTIPYTQVCDFRQDCPDESEETFCRHPPCEEWRCTSGQCVSFDKRCNGYSDCPDDSDEATALCGHVMKGPLQKLHQLHLIDLDGQGYFTHLKMNANETCPQTHYPCVSVHLCLPVYTRCNGYYDCINREDETDCDSATCPGFYLCRASKVCLHVDHVCDGWGQCPQRDDEWLCNMTCPVGCLCHGLSFVCPQPFSAHLYPQLRYLDAMGSGMTLSDLTSNAYLVRLTLSHCSLVTLLVRSFPNMRYIDLSNNNITTVSVNTFFRTPNLRVLLLADNPLASLLKEAVKQTQENLKKIDLSKTCLTMFDSASLMYFPKLESLNLSFSDLQVIGPGGFQRTPRLQELDLREVQVKSFSSNIFHGLNQLSMIYSSNFRVCCQSVMPSMLNRPFCEAPLPIISSCKNILSSKQYQFLFGVFSIFSIFGVLFSLISQLIMEHLFRNSVFISILNLKLGYICMGIYASIITMADNRLSGHYLLSETAWVSSVACKVAGFVSLLSGEVSLLIVWMMTLDDVTILCLRFSVLRFTTKSMCAGLAFIWLLGSLLAVIPLFQTQSLPAGDRGVSAVCQLVFVNKQYLKEQPSSTYLFITFNSIFCLMISVGQLFIGRATPKYSITAGAEKKCMLTSQPLVTKLSVTTSVCWLSITIISSMIKAGTAHPEVLWVTMGVMLTPLSSSLYPMFYWWNYLNEKRRHQKEQRVLQLLKARSSVLYTH